MFGWFARKYRKKRSKLLRRLEEGRRKRFFAPLVTYGRASQGGLLLWHPTQGAVEAPRPVGATVVPLARQYPAVRVHRFRKAITHPESAAILSTGMIAVPEYYCGSEERIISDGMFLKNHRADAGEVELPRTPPGCERGIRLFGAGSMNWYHWLIEILPTAYLARELPPSFRDYPLLAPARHAEIPVFVESLALLAEGRKVLHVPHSALLVDDLLVVDEIVQGPMNLVEGRWPEIGDYAQSTALLAEYRSALLSRLHPAPRSLPKRLFLARGNNRRTYNQDEIAEIATRYGFEAVYPETMDFATQVALFNGAEAIIGPSGAAFANMLFCRQGTTALTWLLREYSGFCAYSNLAHAVGVDLTYLFVASEKPLRSSFDAYGAPYRLDPREFEEAVRRMLHGDAAGARVP